MADPFAAWMVKQNIDHTKTEGATVVVARLRANGYADVADAVEAELFEHCHHCNTLTDPALFDCELVGEEVCPECVAILLAAAEPDEDDDPWITDNPLLIGKVVRIEEWPGVAWMIDAVHCDGDEVRCHMIGDNRPFFHDMQSVKPLKRHEFCGQCGQIGCGCDPGGEVEMQDYTLHIKFPAENDADALEEAAVIVEAITDKITDEFTVTQLAETWDVSSTDEAGNQDWSVIVPR